MNAIPVWFETTTRMDPIKPQVLMYMYGMAIVRSNPARRRLTLAGLWGSEVRVRGYTGGGGRG